MLNFLIPPHYALGYFFYFWDGNAVISGNMHQGHGGGHEHGLHCACSVLMIEAANLDKWIHLI
jgi:hypothetical protein